MEPPHQTRSTQFDSNFASLWLKYPAGCVRRCATGPSTGGRGGCKTPTGPDEAGGRFCLISFRFNSPRPRKPGHPPVHLPRTGSLSPSPSWHVPCRARRADRTRQADPQKYRFRCKLVSSQSRFTGRSFRAETLRCRVPDRLPPAPSFRAQSFHQGTCNCSGPLDRRWRPALRSGSDPRQATEAPPVPEPRHSKQTRQARPELIEIRSVRIQSPAGTSDG